jgi:hypothetical protein
VFLHLRTGHCCILYPRSNKTSLTSLSLSSLSSLRVSRDLLTGVRQTQRNFSFNGLNSIPSISLEVRRERREEIHSRVCSLLSAVCYC